MRADPGQAERQGDRRGGAWIERELGESDAECECRDRQASTVNDITAGGRLTDRATQDRDPEKAEGTEQKNAGGPHVLAFRRAGGGFGRASWFRFGGSSLLQAHASSPAHARRALADQLDPGCVERR